MFNQKGGVAKTTTTVNLGAALAKLGYKTCVIDLDPQGNTCTHLGFKKEDLQEIKSVYECLTEEMPLCNAIIKTKYENLDLVPVNRKMANVEHELTAFPGCETLLKESIEVCMDKLEYDFIIMDCPPSLGYVPLNALVASKEIIVPIEGAFALEGLNELMRTIRLVKKRLNPQLEILGALLTKYVSTTNLSNNLYTELESIFGDKLFKNVIRNNVTIGDSQTAGIPVIYYNPKCAGAEDYISLAKEIVGNGN